MGFIVLRVQKISNSFPPKGGYIVDVVSEPENPYIIPILLKKSWDFFDRENVETIKYWGLRNHPHTKIFKKMGFATSKKLMTVFHRLDLEGYELLKKSPLNKIHFVYGDHDHI